MNRRKPEISTAIILEKRVENIVGKHPVKLRVTYNRQRKYYTIKGAYLSITEYSRIFNGNPRGEFKERKQHIEGFERRARHIIDEVLNDFSFHNFEFEYLNKTTKERTIQSYFIDKIGELDEITKIQTSNLYKATLHSLMEFDHNINFQKVNSNYLIKYEKWMIEKGNSYTTIGMYLRNLKHIVNRAINDEILSISPFNNRKDKYKIPKGLNTKKSLSLSDIEKLFKYETEDVNEQLAKSYFLFSYMCNGINMIDIANLRVCNIESNCMKFIRHKTKDTTETKVEINVLLLPEALEIIQKIGNKHTNKDDYLFPIFSNGLKELEKHNILKQHIKNINKNLKKLAIKIGLNERITTYYARHSYSTVLKLSGAPIEFISEQLGHQSTKVTRSYLNSFEDEHRATYSKNLLGFKHN